MTHYFICLPELSLNLFSDVLVIILLSPDTKYQWSHVLTEFLDIHSRCDGINSNLWKVYLLLCARRDKCMKLYIFSVCVHRFGRSYLNLIIYLKVTLQDFRSRSGAFRTEAGLDFSKLLIWHKNLILLAFVVDLTL